MSPPTPKPDAGSLLFQLLSGEELDDAYRTAKADESEQGQSCAAKIRREIVRRSMPKVFAEERTK